MELMKEEENALETTKDDGSSDSFSTAGVLLTAATVFTTVGYTLMNNFGLR